MNPPFMSPIDYSFSGLTADGATKTVTATFSAFTGCTGTKDYTAPVSCITTGTCNCKEYIYLNEPEVDAILKFEVGAPVALTEKLGANGGTLGTHHWYPGTLPSTINAPHGIAADLNGKLYAGSNLTVTTGVISKLDCDGTKDATYSLPTGPIYNLFSIDNTLFKTSITGPEAYDLCTGSLIGNACFARPDGSTYSGNASFPYTTWGMSYNKVMERAYVTTYNAGDRYLWVYTKSQLITGINSTSETCIRPLLARGTAAQTFASITVGSTWLPNDIEQLMGVTSDNSGNIYLVTWQSGVTPQNNIIILKYNALGQYQARSSILPQMRATHGIVWSETGRIYVANRTDVAAVDCISVLMITLYRISVQVLLILVYLPTMKQKHSLY